MKIETFKHENVLPDGTFSDQPGAVVTGGAVRMSINTGCGLPACNCSEGCWITICTPRDDNGTIFGIRAVFDNEVEMQLFLKTGETS